MALIKLNNQSLTAVTAAGIPVRSGEIIQVKYTVKADTQSIAGSTFTDVMSVSITPTSSSSTILVMCDLNITGAVTNESVTGHRYSGVKLYRDSTQIAVNSEISGIMGSVWFSVNQVELTNTGFTMNQSSGSFIDSPSTTSAITYKIQAGNTNSNTAYTYINRISYGPTDNHPYNQKGVSTITVMEIAG
jgi:hypothetical protein